MVGFDIEVEIETTDGRIDAVVKTETNINIIEFKINQSAKKALQQIKDKKYTLKYANDKRPISLLGINFDTGKRTINDWVIIDKNELELIIGLHLDILSFIKNYFKKQSFTT